MFPQCICVIPVIELEVLAVAAEHSGAEFLPPARLVQWPGLKLSVGGRQVNLLVKHLLRPFVFPAFGPL